VARRGRPPGIDSADTRQRIIDVARDTFARKGYDAAAVTTVAAVAGLAPSAIYHYFGGKAELYEAVFEATARAVWTDLGASTSDHPTLVAAIDAVVEDSRHINEGRPNYSEFLALVPMEARLHEHFAYLLDERTKYQDEAFAQLAELGIRTGELGGFSMVEATEVIRSVIMGWFFERHFRGVEIEGSGAAIQHLFRVLAAR
jgi:AcrR family transcriptional regulator